MTILINKPYLLKVTEKGGGAKIPQNLTTWFMDDPQCQWEQKEEIKTKDFCKLD